MGKLDTSLGEAERLFRQMKGLADSGGADGKNEIVRLRSRYAMLMLDILQAMKDDAKLTGDPALREEFERRFLEMRGALGQHQAKWRLQSIEDDTAGYLRSAASLNTVQNDFYHWVGSNFSLH